MRRKFAVIVFVVSSLFGFHAHAQTSDSGFPIGELSTAKNHTGNIWLSELNVGDSTFDPGIAMATYDPGAKLDWHVHPGAPGVEHWHGATPKDRFAYIAVTPTQKGKTIWLGPVSDRDYHSAQ